MMHYNETEKLRLFARCWNNLDISFIECDFAENIKYDSQWVLTPIIGKEILIDYFKEKFVAIKSANQSGSMFVKAEIGTIPSLYGRPCIVLSQASPVDNRQVTVLLEIQEFLINRIEICFIPSPEEALLSGEIPI